MARRKLSEYRSKHMVSDVLSIDYIGWSINSVSEIEIKQQLSTVTGAKSYVLKVDQGVKGRYKKGLVVLDLEWDDLYIQILQLMDRGYSSFIIEPQIQHRLADERYVSVSYDRRGTKLSFSDNGGVDIEMNASTIQTYKIDGQSNTADISVQTGFSVDQLTGLLELFEREFITMLEINPYVIQDGTVMILDAAIEVDDASSYFATKWNEGDFRQSSVRALSPEELAVQELDLQSPASLKLETINPDGSIFLLLSGGGASVVVADEIYNLGLGAKLANYGEYSGNPSTEETYLYTKAVLQLLLKSKSSMKVLFIGGAVANFTDIAATFTGLIQAIREFSDQLKSQKVKIFVRRGGPRQEIGLADMEATLIQLGLFGAVHDPKTPLDEAVTEAVKEIKQ